jgi:hypothetical protein
MELFRFRRLCIAADRLGSIGKITKELSPGPDHFE